MPVKILLALGAACQRLFGFQTPVDMQDTAVKDDRFAAAQGHAVRFVTRLPSVAGLDVLEIGCGLGGMLSVLAGSGARATGIDVDDRPVKYAQQAGLNAQVADAQKLPFSDASFDLIVSQASLEHFHDIRAALAESHRVLRLGGIFYATWGPSWYSYNGPHLIKCLGVPWVQLLFSDQTIVSALERQREEGVWPASYLDYKIADFQTMGRVSRRKLRDAAQDVGFLIEKETSRSPRPLKNVLGKMPPFTELLPGELTVKLVKER